MTALAEKLKEAGADTIGARLTTACVDALRLHPNNQTAAWAHVGAIFGHEFLRVIAADMNIPHQQRADSTSAVQPYRPRAISPERSLRRAEIGRAIKSKYLNSGGIPWSDVSWHELHGLARDGSEARALLSAGPSNVVNDGRTVSDVLGVNKINEIIGKVRDEAMR